MRAQGFTLVELIIVIVLLSIVSIFTFQIISFSGQVYSDGVAREQLAAQSRFAIERLSRELNNALPRSIRTLDNGNCIEYLPIVTSSEYFSYPSPSNTSQPLYGVRPLDRSTPYGSPLSIALYATGDVYQTSAQVYRIDTTTLVDSGKSIEYTFTDANASFSDIGPVNRYYVVSEPVTWCYRAADSDLARYSNYQRGASYTTAAAIDIMAENLDNSSSGITPFRVSDAILTRNNLVLIDWVFRSAVTDESLTAVYEVHVPNVP